LIAYARANEKDHGCVCDVKVGTTPRSGEGRYYATVSHEVTCPAGSAPG
jgi:hypothetical protein